MPAAVFYRSVGKGNVVTPPTISGLQLPNYTVLFGFDPRYNSSVYLNNTTTAYGKLSKFYRFATEINTGFNSNMLMARNVSSSANWNSITGFKDATNGLNPSNVITVLDGKLGDTTPTAISADKNSNFSGKHGFLNPSPLGQYDMDNPSRPASDIPTILGAVTGDTLSTNTAEKYTLHNVPHAGHAHKITGPEISALFAKINIGKDYTTLNQNPYIDSPGINLCPVVPIILDPALGGSRTVPIDTLPKGVLVFGNDLGTDPNITLFYRDFYDPTQLPTTEDYTRHDYNHELGVTTQFGDSASSESSLNAGVPNQGLYQNIPLYLATSKKDYGVIIPSTTGFSLTASSNSSGNHTHASTTTFFKSTKTGQSGVTLGPSGYHNHNVTYTGTLSLKSKWLNGFITLKDETPLANGMIIAIAPIGVKSTNNPNGPDDWLPQYWHFCDGTNDTPDLRDYFIAVNMYTDATDGGVDNTSLYDTEINYISQASISSISCGLNSGEFSGITTDANKNPLSTKTHSHIVDTGTVGIGTGTPIQMKGSHGANPARWHTHDILTSATYYDADTKTTYNNLLKNTPFSYKPESADLVFIMLNKAIP